jgi:formate dehydrogenase subunit gamma
MPYIAWSKEAALAALELIRDEPGPVLIALQRIQSDFGYVPAEAVEIIANYFNVSRADVHGVLTFYHDLRTTPALKHQIQICVAEACQAVGSRELESQIKARYGEQVSDAFCFGNCALGPAVMVDGKLIGRATPTQIAQALK